MAQTEDRRAKYRAVVDYELAMTQARFQTLAIFIAAVGFVVGRGHLSPSTGALFLLISVGLWIVDLRNRDVLVEWRSVGRDLEEEMLDGAGLDQTRPRAPGWGRRDLLGGDWLRHHRCCRSIRLGRAAIVGRVVVLFAALAAGWGLWKEKKAKAPDEQQ
jgi:hypothetical protein